MNSNRSFSKRILALVIALLTVVLVMAIASPVVAYYIRGTEKKEGSFEPGKPSNPGITDSPSTTQRIAFLSDSETSLENLYIQIPDQGYPVYVRVAVVVNWLTLTDCTCTQPVCGSHICNGCECKGCKECETCAKGLLCENCEKCEHEEDEDCRDCIEVTDCDGCDPCKEGNCKDCTGEGGCTGCALCAKHTCTGCDDENCFVCDENCEICPEECEVEGCKGCEQPVGCNGCDDCIDCEKYCIDRDECPRCNRDETDDWDILPPPTGEGDSPDYSLKIGGKDEVWEKRDSGFYYHKKPVTSSGSATGRIITLDMGTKTPFLEKFERLATAKPPIDVEGLKAEDCILKVEIIVQTLQAIGSTDNDDDAAWVDAWGEGATDWPDKGQ